MRKSCLKIFFQPSQFIFGNTTQEEVKPWIKLDSGMIESAKENLS
jgi:hypothetical protein